MPVGLRSPPNIRGADRGTLPLPSAFHEAMPERRLGQIRGPRLGYGYHRKSGVSARDSRAFGPRSRAPEAAAWLAPTGPATSGTLARFSCWRSREAFRPGCAQSTALGHPGSCCGAREGMGSWVSTKNVASAACSHSRPPPLTQQTKGNPPKSWGSHGCKVHTGIAPRQRLFGVHRDWGGWECVSLKWPRGSFPSSCVRHQDHDLCLRWAPAPEAGLEPTSPSPCSRPHVPGSLGPLRSGRLYVTPIWQRRRTGPQGAVPLLSEAEEAQGTSGPRAPSSPVASAVFTRIREWWM